jgi:hypothetical protein
MSKTKRATKSLQTCPQCGMRGIFSLKSHRCKKGKAKRVEVEIVPAVPNESLKAIEAHLTPIAQRISKKTEDLLYDLVEAGLFLMKAQEAYRVCNVAHAVDGKFDGSNDDEGFQGWLTDKYPQISRRSAYNYINGAKNCGLTIADDATAVEALRSKHALAGKTAGEIYRLTDVVEEEEEEKGGKRWSLIRDAAVNLRQHCEEVVILREQMNKKAFSTVCARLQRTLEELTGSSWDLVDRTERARYKEHGDIYEIGS